MFTEREMTPEEFLIYADQHDDKRFDFIDGELVEVTPNDVHGRIQLEFGTEFTLYLRQNPIGRAYSEVLHVLDGKKMMPDICIHTSETVDYFKTPPLVAVEIRSESQSKTAQRKKALAYIKAGVKMSILVFPREWLEVHRPNREPLKLSYGNMLNGDDVLPGFSVKVDGLL